MLGYSSRKDLQGRTLSDFHLQPESFLQWQQQLQEGGATAEFEGKVRRYDDIIWVRHNAIAVRNTEKQIIYYEGAVADITASKQAEFERIELLERERTARQQAEQANRIKDEFLATLSHELRTPLNAILGWTQLLRMGMDESQLSKGLDVIDRNARAQNRLVDDLLDVSSIIRGAVTLQLQPVELMQVVRAALDTVTPGAKAKKLNIDIKLESAKIKVNGDVARLQQIFWNILSNAVKFTPTEGTIAIASQVKDSTVAIEIRDTGLGIDADVLPYVFDRFRQAETKSSTRTKGGLGLGLAIVRHLVEMHGGEVSADSTGIGRGTVFTVELPLLDREFTEDEAVSADADTSLQDLTLLVVEDESDAREMIALILEQRGAKVITAESVALALVAYERYQPDILISDISMPAKDGFDLIRQIRNSNTPKSALPAIALTAYASKIDCERALAAGFNLHLPKPVEVDSLITSVSLLAKQN